MPTVYHDRIQENFTTTGTGDITVSGAVSGYRAWSTLNDLDTAPYCAVDAATGDWEVGSVLVTKAPAPDASFANVAVLFHANGTNLSTTFQNDATMSGASTLTSTSSTYAYLTTLQKRFGTASLSIASPVTSGNTIQCATLSSSSANAIGTGDFTVEGFIKLNTRTGDLPTIFDYYGGFTTANFLGFSFSFDFGSPGIYLLRGSGGSGNTTFSSLNLFDGLWHHVALSRTSGVTRAFVDGTQQGSSLTDTTNYSVNGSSEPIRVGSGARHDLNLNGFIDEFRFTVGVGRYTSNFTPTSTEFGTAASSGAVTLARTPQSSSNSNALVSFASGTKQVFLTTPASFFSPRVNQDTSIDFSNGGFLLHFNGGNGLLNAPDSSPNKVPFTWTAGGSMQISTTQSVYGSSSLRTGSSSGRLATPRDNSSITATGSQPWTLKFYIWIPSVGSQQVVFDTNTVSTNNTGWIVYIDTDGKLKLYSGTNATVYGGYGSALTASTWTACAITFDGSSLRFFVGGVLLGTGTGFPNTWGDNVYVGNSAYNSQSYSSYLDEFLWLPNVCKHTATYVVESAPFVPAR